MPFLMDINFDNNHRLWRKSYLFEYQGIRFKLVQGDSRKHFADHLLTILPNSNRAACEHAFFVASQFVSALAWQTGGTMTLWEAGGLGVKPGCRIEDARPFAFTFHQVPFGGRTVGYSLDYIPHVRTEPQRIALALFREANASNSCYLSFLFYWQILEVNGGKPVDMVDNAVKKAPPWLPADEISRLPLGGRSLGAYLADDCRHAIAHIRRWPGKKRIDLDKSGERTRLAISTRVISYFAADHIRTDLGLTGYLYLARKKRRDFPKFVDSEAMKTGFIRAYPQCSPAMGRLLARRRRTS